LFEEEKSEDMRHTWEQKMSKDHCKVYLKKAKFGSKRNKKYNYAWSECVFDEKYSIRKIIECVLFNSPKFLFIDL
jgi:hypothetical protein